MSDRGFTLIELSIVLVIIGLIVGGVLVGRDLIKAAEIRAAVSEMEKLDTALSTFKLKYNALAGDMVNASDFGLTQGAGFRGNPNGDGNGQLNYNTATTETDEDRKVFAHLYSAGLWPYSNGLGGPNGGYWNLAGTVVPSSFSSSIYVAASGVFNNVPSTWGQPNGFHFYLSGGNAGGGTYGDAPYTNTETYNIDSKMDDGLPYSGKVQAWVNANQPSGPGSAGAAGSASCVNSDVTPNTYNTTYATPKCVLGFKMAVYE